MQSPPPALAAPRLGMRANQQIAGQIRRFALAWVVVAVAIMAAIAVTRAATNAYRDNELHIFQNAWRNWESQVQKVKVQKTNGQSYDKFIPEPFEDDEEWR